MSKRLVSIIIPAHNAVQYIAATLQSAISQTHRNIEIIVVDDSRDGELEAIANGISDPRIRVLQTECRGASASRNFGYRVSRGEYIQFLDADDLISRDKIERQLAVLINAGGAAIASCGWSHFTEQPSLNQMCPEPVWDISSPLTWLQVSLTGGGMMQTACWLMPRSVCDAAGPWDESLSLHDDGEFFTRVLLKAERQIFVNDCCVHYRKVPGSLSRRRNAKAIQSAFDVCELRSRRLLDFDQSYETRQALATSYAQFAYEFSRQAPELAADAVCRIRDLNAVPVNAIGGKWFRRVCSTVGWENAFRLRDLLRRGLRHR